MPERFVDAMRLLAGGVTIVTVGTGDAIAGLTATAVCSLTTQPPRLLVCLNRSGSTYQRLIETGSFCVNILAADQQELAIDFAGRTGKAGPEKFADQQWICGPNHSPRHRGALAAVDCRVHLLTLLDSHAIVFGDVVGTHVGEAKPSLLYREGKFI